jgi:hypothetical protein
MKSAFAASNSFFGDYTIGDVKKFLAGEKNPVRL